MKYFIVSCLLISSSSLMSQTEKRDDGYYSDEQRDPIAIDQKEKAKLVSESDCSKCDTKQSQEETPIYIMMPPAQVPAPSVAPAKIDYSLPQVGPDYYKQFQSGNYQFQVIPTN